MRNELVIGMALGAIVGAFIVENNQMASDIVSTSKKAIKTKVKDMMPKKTKTTI